MKKNEKEALAVIAFAQVGAQHKRVMELAQKDKADELKVLIDGGAQWNFAIAGRHGDGTPLHVAVRAGSVEVVNLLVGLGMPPDVSHPAVLDGETPLVSAAGDRACVPCLQPLLDAGLDLGLGSRHGWTALHIAALSDNQPLVDALLAAGADPDARPVSCVGSARNRSQRTALELAAYSGYLGIVQSLIAAGADVNCIDVNRETPLHSACRKGSAEVVRALVAAGANLHELNSSGRTPLYLALKSDNIEAAAWLLEHLGIKVDPKTVVDGRTLRQHFSGRAEGLQRLLSEKLYEKIEAQFAGGEERAAAPSARRPALSL